MAKTRETNLGKYLREAFEGVDVKSELPSFNEIRRSKYYGDLLYAYNALGGVQKEIPYGIKQSHIDYFIDGSILELDEENHFNRYRLVTLNLPLYKQSNILDLNNYRQYCEKFESMARTNGGFWTNSSCERLFGKAAENKCFDGNGAPRWKQRAFYDTMKDYFSVVSGLKVRRISIYDRVVVQGINMSIHQVLEVHNPRYTHAINQLIAGRH